MIRHRCAKVADKIHRICFLLKVIPDLDEILHAQQEVTFCLSYRGAYGNGYETVQRTAIKPEYSSYRRLSKVS